MPLKRRTHRRGIYRTPSQTVTSSSGTGKNYVRTVTHTPSDTEVEEESNQASLNLPKGPSGSAGAVVIVGTLLLVSVTWNDFWKPYFDTLLNGTSLQTNVDGRMVLGGILFIVIAGFIASTSPEAGGVMIVFMIGLWLVYITVGQGGGQLNKFFGWFQQSSTAGASDNFGSTSATPAPTVPKGGAGTTKQ